ncbi:MAG: class I SAM-dependent methyltransferase [Chitinophagaceae bacterium]
MNQPSGKILMFRNRLEKVFRHLSKQAKRQSISCFRIYDHDVPEYPFIIEIYEDKLYVSEYKRHHQLSDHAHAVWMEEALLVMVDVIGIERDQIFIKLRKRKEGRADQYQKLDEVKNELVVTESGLKFIVNLTDYLDTGLFLDHRITRQMVLELASKKRVLNLFCYTGSFSVYALAGGAVAVDSVDLSKTYLHWAERNTGLNFPNHTNRSFIAADVLQFLKTGIPESYDLIIMDPPTFSNSKRMNDFLDIQQDHVSLINDCMRLLSREGILIFSTNYRKFSLQKSLIKATEIKDITKATTPFDFNGKLHRQCFIISK